VPPFASQQIGSGVSPSAYAELSPAPNGSFLPFNIKAPLPAFGVRREKAALPSG
jgi:hypothetical protein